MRIIILLGLCSMMMAEFGDAQSSDGSKCPGVSCSPPTPGAQCEAKYERDDGCCPVWYCTLNGYTSTVYGKMTAGGGSGSSQSSYSSSSSTGGGSSSSFSQSSGSIGSLPGFQFQLPNLANLFG